MDRYKSEEDDVADDREDFFVRVTLTPSQARVVVAALDLYSRICCGQFSEIASRFAMSLGKHRDMAETLLQDVRTLCFPKLDERAAGYGIAECPDESARVSFDVLQVVRQVEIKARDPQGPSYLIPYQDPMFVSRSVPRPTAQSVTILDRLVEDQ